MFYVVSKVVGFFLIPSNFLIGLGIVGILLLATRFTRLAKALMASSVILMAVIGFLPVGVQLTLPLEQRFPPWQATTGSPTGIIVLGGVIDPAISRARGDVALGDAAERITAGAILARRFPTAKLVFSGGDLSSSGAFVEADYAVELFQALGLPRERLIAERRSRNTAENASFTKELLAPKPGERWLLVTTAMHMPRAIGAFRKAGFAVEAYPVNYTTMGPDDAWILSGSTEEGIRRTDDVVHEWIGLLAYWITGRTSELFPRP